MRNLILTMAIFALSISGYSQNGNGKLLYDCVYTQNGNYVSISYPLNQQQWGNDGARVLTEFTIYEKCLYHDNKSYPYIGNEVCLGEQCRRYGSDNDNYYLVDKNGNVKWAFSLSVNTFVGNIRTTTYFFFDYGNWITNPLLNGNSSYPSTPSVPSSPSTPSPTTKRVTCSFCGGRGEVFGDFSTQYGGVDSLEEWCAKCGKYLIPHYHKPCPVCKGKGTEEKIQW